MVNKLSMSSIGKKLVMSISGAFLVLFLAFHMCMNLVLVFDAEAYNAVCGFLGANWYAVAGTVVLAAGVGIHFICAIILSIQNLKARGNIRYAVTVKEQGVEWSSKNMLVLGIVVVLGLLVHLVHFWSKMQLVELMGMHENSLGLSPTDGAALVQYTFSKLCNVIIYIVWLVALWFHLTHGVWSMLHTAGLNNKRWMKFLKCFSKVVATIIVGGFIVTVLAIYIGQ